MFRRKVSVELSGEAQRRLDSLGEDVAFLVTLATDLQAQHKQLLDLIRTDITIAVDRIESTSLFDEAEAEIAETRKSGKPRRFSHRVEMPKAMSEPPPRLDRPSEVQSTPFTRASRGEQVRWLTQVLASVESESGWIAPHEIAEFYAENADHRRYLRRAIPRRISEMYEDQEAPLDRRRYSGRGSMFEYRLRK